MTSKSRIWLYLVAALVLLNSDKNDKKTKRFKIKYKNGYYKTK